MTVSKRVRFEVLRRDQHTCQYCGGKAPEVDLTVDHVIPKALGGGDDPSNLVAACRDCNAGKTSTNADGPLVEQVSSAAAEFALGLRNALHAQGQRLAEHLEVVDRFMALWDRYVPQFRRNSWRLPADFESSVLRWHDMGVTDETFEYAIRIAMAKKDVDGTRFAYMAGVLWNVIRKAEADSTVAGSPHEDLNDDYEAGWHDGQLYAAADRREKDFLASLIDGLPTATYRYSEAYGSLRCPSSVAELEQPGKKARHYARASAF